MNILSFPTIITKLLVLLISFPIHELAHAWTANHYGDDTPKLHGRLTMNPFAHLDVAGSIIFLVSYFGWAKPVPVNPEVLKRHSRFAYLLVSLAGPLSNLILAILVAIPFRLGLLSYSNTLLSQVLLNFIIFNLILAIFNLIPISPLDGGKILGQLLPYNLQPIFARIDRYGPIILMALLFVLPMIGFDFFGAIMNPILSGLFAILTGR
jgi:Zn-dependent protease